MPCLPANVLSSPFLTQEADQTQAQAARQIAAAQPPPAGGLLQQQPHPPPGDEPVAVRLLQSHLLRFGVCLRHNIDESEA